METEAEAFYAQWPEKMHQVQEQMPEAARAFTSLFQSLMKPGALSLREKELIALGIGLAARCAPCINTHIEKSLHAGATREQVLETAAVAVVMQGGPAFTALPKVIEALDAIQSRNGGGGSSQVTEFDAILR